MWSLKSNRLRRWSDRPRHSPQPRPGVNAAPAAPQRCRVAPRRRNVIPVVSANACNWNSCSSKSQSRSRTQIISTPGEELNWHFRPHVGFHLVDQPHTQPCVYFDVPPVVHLSSTKRSTRTRKVTLSRLLFIHSLWNNFHTLWNVKGSASADWPSRLCVPP